MATYYKKIKGKNYDGQLIKVADSSVRGKGDGRISLKDAKRILGAVSDSDDYSQIEKNTVRYIRDHYSFTPEADRWFRTEIRKWAASKGPIKKTVKKSVKKSAKKSVKKTAKKAAKKAARKPVKKAVVKKATPKRPAPRTIRQPLVPPVREEYEYEERMQPARSSPARKKKPSTGITWLLGIIIAAIIIGLYVSPQCGNRIKNAFCPADRGKEAAVEKLEPVVPAQEEPAEAVIPEEKTAPAPEEPIRPAREIEGAYYYTVQPKDDLISISRKLLNDYSKWRGIYEANKDIITTPYVIHPGQRLRIPGLEAEK